MEKKYYYGNAISDYGIKNGYVDYATFARAFNCVLNNDILSSTYDIGYWEQVSGQIDNSDEIEEEIEEIEDEEYEEPEIFQYFIVDRLGAELLQDINEILFFNEELDMYVWGVTLYGTVWDYVLTSIEIDW